MAEKAKVFNHQQVIGSKKDLGQIVLSEKDVSLYALGIGFSLDPLRTEDFKYTNQKSQNFTTFPTITAAMRLKDNLSFLQTNPFVPKYETHQLLHAEEKCYLLQPRILVGVRYRQVVEIVDLVDKGKNAFLYLRHSAYIRNSKGQEQLAFYVDRTIFLRGLGGFGFKGKGATRSIPQTPKRNPDYLLKNGTFPSQAFIYRLSDDDNILHIDPEVSKKAGYERPIIHGMASYGVVARSLVQNLLGNNPQSFGSLEVRLVGHVFPGESFTIKVWKQGEKLHFQVEVVQRKAKALVGVLTTRSQSKL